MFPASVHRVSPPVVSLFSHLACGCLAGYTTCAMISPKCSRFSPDDLYIGGTALASSRGTSPFVRHLVLLRSSRSCGLSLKHTSLPLTIESSHRSVCRSGIGSGGRERATSHMLHAPWLALSSFGQSRRDAFLDLWPAEPGFDAGRRTSTEHQPASMGSCSPSLGFPRLFPPGLS